MVAACASVLVTSTGRSSAAVVAESIDPGFGGGDGVDVFHPDPPGGPSYFGQDVVVHADGSVVTVGFGVAELVGNPCVGFVSRHTDAGELDPTFGGDGIVTSDDFMPVPPVFIGEAYWAVAAAESGAVYVGGGRRAACHTVADTHSVVHKFSSTGEVLATFENDPPLDEHGFGVTGVVRGLAVQPDGKVIAVTHQSGSGFENSSADFDVLRLTADLELDPDFGVGGIVSVDIGTDTGANDDDAAYAVALHDDGRIVVAGASFGGFEYHGAIVRLEADGSLDATFGSGGIMEFDPSEVRKFTAVVVGADDVVTAVGMGWAGDPVLASVDGAVATVAAISVDGFGMLSDGGCDHNVVPVCGGYDLALDDDGSMYVSGGFVDAVNGGQPAVLRLTPTGEPDTTFGVGGVAVAVVDEDETLDDVSSVTWSAGWADAIAIAGPGRLAVAGTAYRSPASPGPNRRAVVARFLVANTAPLLDAIGDRSVDEHATLEFTATATDGDDPPQTLTFTLADGSGAVPDGAAIDPVTGAFTWTPAEAQGPGVYVFDVVVTDDGTPALSDREEVEVTVHEVNSPPVAVGGADLEVAVGETVSLDGSGSFDLDLPSQPLGFSWELVSSPVGSTATLAEANTASPSFTADVAGAYVVSLTVNDGVVDSDPDAVTVVASLIAACDIVGTSGPDVLVGTPAGETICGLGGNDVLDGAGGDDILLGGAGDDVLVGGPGTNVIDGDGGPEAGVGVDTADYRSSARAVRVDLAAGTARGDGSDTLVGIENVRGSSGGDRITGDDGPNRLWGEGGRDVLSGNDGPDRLFGGADSDTLRGGAGDDELWGEDGNDRLEDDIGADRFDGGAGTRDVCVGAGLDDVVLDCERVR